MDWFTPDGLPDWGDGRLFLVGTEGTLELRKNLDIEEQARRRPFFVANQHRDSYQNCVAALPVLLPGNPRWRAGPCGPMEGGPVFSACRAWRCAAKRRRNGSAPDENFGQAQR